MPKMMEYVNYLNAGTATLAEDGTEYVFEQRSEGPAVCVVEDRHVDELLKRNQRIGKAVFRVVVSAAGVPYNEELRNYEALSREQLRQLYLKRTGKPAPGRTLDETLIEQLRELDRIGDGRPAEEPEADTQAELEPLSADHDFESFEFEQETEAEAEDEGEKAGVLSPDDVEGGLAGDR